MIVKLEHGALRKFWVCSGLLWVMLLDLDRRFRLLYLLVGNASEL